MNCGFSTAGRWVGHVARSTAIEQVIAAVERALRAVDDSAFLVQSRVLRRVIKQDGELPGLGFYVPHRKSHVIAGERLLNTVAPDELGLESAAALPPRVILIARPDEQELAELSDSDLLRNIWRLLFHARVHVAFDERFATGALNLAAIRARIDRIGQTEFDEIHAVLRQEHYLATPADYPTIYTEFAAVYLELRYFAPDWLPAYFPSVDDFERIDDVLAEDIDAARLFHDTRLDGAAEVGGTEIIARGAPQETTESPNAPVTGKRAEKTYRRLVRLAQHASGRGNAVRAAILHARAVRYARSERAADAAAGATVEIDRLTRRLQAALGFDEAEAGNWREALAGLLANSKRGFWNADARLLYDLQKVCVDHEREVSVVDLVEWVRSLGKRPIIRPLPNQREVLMSKHLRSATRRLTSARLTGGERDRLSVLLHAAARSAEEQLRTRLRPLVAQALWDVGLEPRNLPERVALKKLIEELLDGVVQRGYLTMGSLRDAISRNNLKLEDLSGPLELWQGDRLLQADRAMDVALDGVYHRGEFYLRWLQGLSSLAFGTRTGRFLTQYVAIPFGGAFVALEGLDHLVSLLNPPSDEVVARKAPLPGLDNLLNNISEQFLGHPLDVMGRSLVLSLKLFGIDREIRLPWAVLALGFFLVGVIHLPRFRAAVASVLRTVYRVLRGVLVDFPLWVARLHFVRAILRSTAFTWLRRFVITPLLFTGLIWASLPLFGLSWNRSPAVLIGIFFVLNLVLNSRAGRDIEELTAEWLDRTWYQIRVRIFVALFEVIMETFKWVLETIERVLYAVDEWLRFKSGESSLTLAVKGVLGIAWSVISFVIRFCVTLLIEPQINPIKHFPVVTVSHKIILPTQPFLKGLMIGALGTVWANAVAAATVLVAPGVFGFLVWELKANWRLYAANRAKQLQPVLVGEHGETLIRLMKLGLHSGTLPKLYGKLRRANRKFNPARRIDARTKYLERLQHQEVAIRHFVERELLEPLAGSRAWGALPIEVGEIEIASNSLRIELRCPRLSESGLWLSFQEQSGWLVACVLNSGWLVHLPPEKAAALSHALAGFYKIGGVDLIREQIDACFEAQPLPYDITEGGLVVWPGARYEHEIFYNLEQRPTITPRPRAVARSLGCPPLAAQHLLFNLLPITWDEWVHIWEADRAAESAPPLLPKEARLLPLAERVPLAEIG